MILKIRSIPRRIRKAYYHNKALGLLQKGKSAHAEEYFLINGVNNSDVQVFLNAIESNLEIKKKDVYASVLLGNFLEHSTRGLTREAFHRFLKVEPAISLIIFDCLYKRLKTETVLLEDFEQALMYERYLVADAMLGRYTGDCEALSNLIASVPPENRGSQDFQYLEVNVAERLSYQRLDHLEFLQGR